RCRGRDSSRSSCRRRPVAVPSAACQPRVPPIRPKRSRVLGLRCRIFSRAPSAESIERILTKTGGLSVILQQQCGRKLVVNHLLMLVNVPTALASPRVVTAARASERTHTQRETLMTKMTVGWLASAVSLTATLLTASFASAQTLQELYEKAK